MLANIKLLALSAAATSVLAAPAPAQQASSLEARQTDDIFQPGYYDANYFWSVTNWQASVARSGGYYSFDISGFAYQSYPAFSAQCTGGPDGGPFALCANTGDVTYKQKVAARLLPNDSKGATIQVSFDSTSTTDPQTLTNVTGTHTASYNQAVGYPENFSIYPDRGYSIAILVSAD